MCAGTGEVQTHLLLPLCVLNSSFSMIIHYIYICISFDAKLCVMLVVTHRASVVAYSVIV